DGGQQAVAGAREVALHDVAGLLAAEEDASLPHRLDDVAVSHVAADDADTLGREGPFEPEIAHRGGHDSGRLKPAAAVEAGGPQIEDGVAIADFAPLVSEDAAVGIAVERRTEVRAFAGN